MTTGSCPECEAEIHLENTTEVGEIIVCPDCDVDQGVTSLCPATMDLLPIEEDWGK